MIEGDNIVRKLDQLPLYSMEVQSGIDASLAIIFQYPEFIHSIFDTHNWCQVHIDCTVQYWYALIFIMYHKFN